jgi:hypothetical protein
MRVVGIIVALLSGEAVAVKGMVVEEECYTVLLVEYFALIHAQWIECLLATLSAGLVMAEVNPAPLRDK